MNELDIQQRPFRELALFAGSGGGILGGHLLGWRTVCAVEWDAYAASILVQRQNDQSLPIFPVWDDVSTFDGRPWRGRVDIISGGFPCQDISAAGKGAGIDGERSGMWGHMARIIGAVRPEFCLVENSPLLVGRGLARVLGDLASLGYDARWGVLGAHHVAAPHKRERIWILAHAPGTGRPGGEGCVEADRRDLREEIQASSRRAENLADAERPGLEGHARDEQGGSQPGRECAKEGRSTGKESLCGSKLASWWASEPLGGLGRVVDGMAPELDVHGANALGGVGRMEERVPDRVHRLKCIGNGQVPATMALAWRILTTDE